MLILTNLGHRRLPAAFFQESCPADACTNKTLDMPMPAASADTSLPCNPAVQTDHDSDLPLKGSFHENEHTHPSNLDTVLIQGCPDSYAPLLIVAGSTSEQKRCRSRSPAAGPLRAPRMQVQAVTHQQELLNLQTVPHAFATSTAPLHDDISSSKFVYSPDVSTHAMTAYEQPGDGKMPDCFSARSSSSCTIGVDAN